MNCNHTRFPAQSGILFVEHISTTRFKECLAINTNKQRGKVMQAKIRTAATTKRINTDLVGLKGGGIFIL